MSKRIMTVGLVIATVSCGGMRPHEIRRQRALEAGKTPATNRAKPRVGNAARDTRVASPPPSLIVRRTPSNKRKMHPKVHQRCKALLPVAKRITSEVGIDLDLVMAVAQVESRYNPQAKNRRSGATGLMQVMPSTGRGFKCGNLQNMESNLRCGSRILKRYLRYFDGELIYGIAAYHSGPVAPKKARAAKKLPSNMNYVEKVLKLRTRFRKHGCG